MGKIDFSQLRPTAPIEALVGASAIARGIYLYIADILGKNTVVTTDSVLYNIVVGTVFLASGLLLTIGALYGYHPFRFVGLTLVGLQTLFILTKTISADVTTFPLVAGNLTVLGICGWLIYILLKEEA